MNQPSSLQEDNLFATEAIRRGYVTVAQIEEAKAVQKKLAEIGLQEPLSSVMVKRNYLTREQATSLAMGGKDTGKVVIPGYKVTSKIGSGGMGTVYKATQLSIGRQVAIKILSSKLGQDPQYAERFAREAKALAQLNHVNIVAAIDAGRVGNVMYYVMEFVEGESLGDVLKRRRKIPEAEALHIAVQATRALDHANAHGIIHRDIKPDNILMTKDGIAKLTDLGLAKSKGEDANLTQTGIAIGTPNYISPEQARGERDLDTRSDIYSLGATLYHMVVGEAPFKGSSALEVVTKHLTEQLPSPKALNPVLSDGICIVVEKMMAKRREDRYQNPQDLMEDLELVTDGKMPKARRPAVGRSAVMQRVAIPGGAGKETKSRPTTSFTRTSRSTATQLRIPSSKSNYAVPLAIAAGVLILIVVIALASRGGQNIPSSTSNDGQSRNTQDLVVDKKPPAKPAAPEIKLGPKKEEKKPFEIGKKDSPKPQDRPQPPTPDPGETLSDAAREAELLIKQMAYAVDELKAAGRYRDAMAKLDEIENKKKEKGIQSYDVANVRESVREEAGRIVGELETAVNHLVAIGAGKRHLTEMEGALMLLKEHELPEYLPRVDAMLSKVKTAVADFNNPIKARNRFRDFYATSVKVAVDKPCLNFETAAWLIENVMDARGDFAEYKDDFKDVAIREEMQALRRDFDDVAHLMKKLREAHEVDVNDGHKHIRWSDRINGPPDISLSAITIDEEPALDNGTIAAVLRSAAKRVFKEKTPDDKRLLTAAVLLHAYGGADFSACEKMAKAFKLGDEKKLLDRVRLIRENSYACDFARGAEDIFGWLENGPAVVANVEPKDQKPPKDIKIEKPKEEKKDPPKANYNVRTIFSSSAPQGEIKETLAEWEKDKEIVRKKNSAGWGIGVPKGEKRKLLRLGEEMEDVEIDIIYRNTADEYTRFFLRSSGDGGEPENAIRIDVKIVGEHKGRVDGKIKVHRIVNRKEKEIVSEHLEDVPAASGGEGFVRVVIRLSGERLFVYVNKQPKDPSPTLMKRIEEAPDSGIPCVEIPEYRHGDEIERMLYIYSLKLQRLKEKE